MPRTDHTHASPMSRWWVTGQRSAPSAKARNRWMDMERPAEELIRFSGGPSMEDLCIPLPREAKVICILRQGSLRLHTLISRDKSIRALRRDV